MCAFAHGRMRSSRSKLGWLTGPQELQAPQRPLACQAALQEQQQMTGRQTQEQQLLAVVVLMVAAQAAARLQGLLCAAMPRLIHWHGSMLWLRCEGSQHV